MPELWSNPTRFAPERAEDKVHKFAYVPFGGGVHKCLGMHFADMQVKAVLHQLLLSYRWTVDGNYQFAMDYSTLPKQAGSLPMAFTRL